MVAGTLTTKNEESEVGFTNRRRSSMIKKAGYKSGYVEEGSCLVRAESVEPHKNLNSVFPVSKGFKSPIKKVGTTTTMFDARHTSIEPD
jgi:hypothetical protein